MAKLSQDRAFDPVDLLLGCTEGRLPKLLPVKYDRMRATPFAFFRGSASIMAADLAAQPRTAITVQLCGDAHVQNLGCFEGIDGRLIFDINDFDETLPGPWEWDVKRMAASIVLAGYDAGHSRSSCSSAVHQFVESYAGLIDLLAREPVLTAARYQIHRARQAQAISAALRQAERASPCDLLKKYTQNGHPATQNGRGGKDSAESEGSNVALRRASAPPALPEKDTQAEETARAHFKSIKNVLWPITGRERSAVLRSLSLYIQSLSPERQHLFRFFQPVDAAFKIVGTGSVALRDYVLLMLGNGAKDPLFLQIKQEVSSAYAPYLGNPVFQNQALRVADGQRHIQPLSDPLLGWTQIDGRDFLVRQLNDHKGSIDIENLRGSGLSSLAEVAGELLARGHARSGDPAVLRGYIGSSGRISTALARFAIDYASQTERDFEEFQKAIHDGRVPLPAK